MAIIRYPGFSYYRNPFQELARVRREMDRVFADFSGRDLGAAGSGVFPALIVTEDADKIFVQAELPGIQAEDIDISVVGSTLTLGGERKPDSVENAGYHRRERSSGRFKKAITLPYDVDPGAVEAQYKDGVLRLILPKAEHAKPRKISVKVG